MTFLGDSTRSPPTVHASRIKAYMYLENRVLSSPNSSCMLPVAAAQSCSVGVAIRCVHPVLWMTSCLPQVGHLLISDSPRAAPGTESDICDCLVWNCNYMPTWNHSDNTTPPVKTTMRYLPRSPATAWAKAEESITALWLIYVEKFLDLNSDPDHSVA